jgi:chaperonin GroES
MIRPLKNYVLIEPIEDDTTSVGGVYLPDSTKDKPCKGKVVNIASNITLVEIGQIVFYKKWVNETVKSNGKELLFVKVEDLLGVEL